MRGAISFESFVPSDAIRAGWGGRSAAVPTPRCAGRRPLRKQRTTRMRATSSDPKTKEFSHSTIWIATEPPRVRVRGERWLTSCCGDFRLL